MHNSAFVIKYIQKQLVKNVRFRKKYMQLFIALLVSELTLQWINPGHHHVSLFIGSSKILVSSSYTGGFLSYERLFMLQ